MAGLPSLSTLIRTAAVNLRLSADPIAAPAAVAPVRAVIEQGQGLPADSLRVQLQSRGPVTAQVVAALGGNRYLVDVEGQAQPVVIQTQAANAALEAGSGVRLIVQPSPSASPEVPQPTVPGQATELSTLGRMIADATRPGPDRTSLGASALNFAPLHGTPARPAEAAQALQKSVNESGLFYESHLAQWATGQRPAGDLQREPQAQLHVDPRGFGTGTVDDTAPSAANAPPGLTSAAALHLDPQASQIVREQLQTLTTQQFVWHGQVWPDQTGELEIGREPSAAAEAVDVTWRASLRLTLPNLGEVAFKLALHGDALDLRVGADNPASSALLQKALPPLTEALGERGLKAHPVVQPTAVDEKPARR